MEKIRKSLIVLFIAIAAMFTVACFDDEDYYYDDYDDDAEELYYDYYGYDDDSYYDDDDEGYDYYDDDYDGYDYDDYDDYEEEDGGWLSLLFDLFGLSDEDYYEDGDYGYDDYGSDYDDDYSTYDNSESAYDYYFNDTADTAGKSPYYAVDAQPLPENNVPADAADWTVFIYLCGSDLESNSSCGVMDLKEISKAANGSNVNVLIETGGSKKWHGYGIKPDDLERFILKDGKITRVQTLPKASMGKAKTLSDFISWGAKNYPAKKYAFDFWDHGSGSVNGVCFDENYIDSTGNPDSLVNSELRQAFADAGVRFELFIFDSCLSATIEIADTLSYFGNYMVASEEVLLGECLSYDKWITSLSKNPEQTGADLGKQIAQYYSVNMKNIGSSSSCTMSVIDLSRVEHVKLAFQAMASQMTQKTENVTSFRNLVRNSARGVKYGSASENEGYTNLIDLGEFAQNASSEVPEQAQAVIAAIKKAVVYEVHGRNEGNSSGIAVYYPVKYNYDTQDYANNVDNRPYLQYLDAILQEWTAPSWVYQDKRVRAFTPVQKSSYNLTFDTSIKKYEGDERYSLKIKSGLDSVNSVTMNLFWYDEEAEEFLYLGNDDDIYADWEKGNFYDNFQGEWITIGDCYVNAELIESNENYNFYSVPVELNGKDTNLRLRYDLNKDKFKLLGAYDGIEEGAASKGLRRLKEGDKIGFVFYAIKDDGTDEEATEDDVNVYIGGEVTYSKNLPIEYSELFDGLYYYQFEIEDIFGNVEVTDFIEMEYTDGMIYLGVDDE